MPWALLLDVLGTGLKIWESKEKTKYLDKYLKLKKEYYEETNKQERDDAVIDNLEFELQLLSQAFSAKAGKSTAENMQG